MSLFLLGSTAMARRGAAEKRAAGAPPRTADTVAAGAGDDQQKNALAALAMFVPAETIAIFVTVAATVLSVFHAIGNPAADLDRAAAWGWYVICMLLTPFFAWIGAATQWRKDHNGSFPTWSQLPRYRIIVSVVAFAVWGLAVAPALASYIFCDADKCGVTDSGLLGAVVIVVGVVLTALDGLINYDTPQRSDAPQPQPQPQPQP